MLHQNDLIFCKTESGLTSCGYNISNMLLKNTLHMPSSHYIGTGNGNGNGNGNGKRNGKDDIQIAKLMEDLVVPSGLYYCHPMTKHKVFNYKQMDSSGASRLASQEKGEKGEKHEIDIVNGMLDESVYDKLLTLVSMDKRKIFDKKTRKNKNTLFEKVKSNIPSPSPSPSPSPPSPSTMDADIDVDTPSPKVEKGEKGEKGEKVNKKKSMKIKTQPLSEKQKPNQRKTKKVRFADF